MHDQTRRPRIAAFYLPQFHPIPENDRFWGPGFTEWRNVVQARPLFEGHDQPRLPGELGFYDLRLPEVLGQQAQLARQHGVDAFCIYHYWFNGAPLLERPLQELHGATDIDQPYFLCWANENWTRRWDGLDREILVEQHYSAEDDMQHFEWMLPFLRDERYVRHDGMPVVLVYRLSALPDPRATAERWRKAATDAGLGGLHLCRVESFEDERRDPRELGFDAAVEFQPDWPRLIDPLGRTRPRRAARALGREGPWFRNDVYDYEMLVEQSLAKDRPAYERYRCVTPRWDNTARRTEGATIFVGATADRYERWLRRIHKSAVAERSPFVFVNAWNEWAEGAHLEPDLAHGRAYLEATRRAVFDLDGES